MKVSYAVFIPAVKEEEKQWIHDVIEHEPAVLTEAGLAPLDRDWNFQSEMADEGLTLFARLDVDLKKVHQYFHDICSVINAYIKRFAPEAVFKFDWYPTELEVKDPKQAYGTVTIDELGWILSSDRTWLKITAEAKSETNKAKHGTLAETLGVSQSDVSGLGDASKLQDGDYELVDGCAWFTVKNLSIRINATDEGVAVDIYPINQESADAIAGTWALFTEGDNPDV
jgi:hypothetical protein